MRKNPWGSGTLAKFTELGRGVTKMHTQVSSSDAENVCLW